MTHVTCRLTAKNRDQLRNPTLGNQVRATFTSTYLLVPGSFLMYSITNQEIGWEVRLRHDPILCRLGCETLTQSVNLF